MADVAWRLCLWFLHSSTEFTAEGSICSRSLPGSDACAMAVHSSVCTVICLLTDVILEAPPYTVPQTLLRKFCSVCAMTFARDLFYPHFIFISESQHD
jgi:hypothetical protein